MDMFDPIIKALINYAEAELEIIEEPEKIALLRGCLDTAKRKIDAADIDFYQDIVNSISSLTDEQIDSKEISEILALAVSSSVEDPDTVTGSKKIQLFSNPIENENVFGMTRSIADRYNWFVDNISEQTADDNYRYNPGEFKRPDNRSYILQLTKEHQSNIKTSQQFYEKLLKIKDGKVLQTFLTLWSAVNVQNYFRFNDVRLSDLMKLVLKPNKDGYFTQPQKRAFTEALDILRSFEIHLDEEIREKDERGRKKRRVRRNFYRLFELESAVYAKRRDGTVDESVIIRFTGELLPKYNKGIMRGRLYQKGLLRLDANKDSRALLLGFKLLTRFDQIRMGSDGQDNISDEKLYIRMDRKTLIKWAEYEQTDKNDKWTASKYLENTLEKLIKARILRDYDPKPIGTENNQKIFIYPYPIAVNKRISSQR